MKYSIVVLRLARLVLLPALLAVTISGCVVVSVNPWLDRDDSTLMPQLTGFWADTKDHSRTATASFVISPDKKGCILTLTNSPGDAAWHYECTLHSMKETLFLQAGPQTDAKVDSPFAVLPVYMLFKIELTDTTLKIFPVDRNSFSQRAKKCGLILAETGKEVRDSKGDEPIVVGSSTTNLEKFIDRNLKDKTFFTGEPLYSFTKVSTDAAATAESKSNE